VRGGAIALIVQGSGALLVLGIDMLLGRWLGVVEYGLFALANAWLTILAIVAALGFNQALLKFVPIYESQNAWPELKGVLRFAHVYSGLAAVAIFMAGMMLLWALEPCCISSGVLPAFAWALGALPFMAWSSLRQASLRGLGAVGRAFLPDYVLRPLLLLLGLLLLHKLQFALDAAGVLALNFLAVFIAFMIGSWWLKGLLPHELKGVPIAPPSDDWLAMAMPMLLIISFNLISNRVDILMLGGFASRSDVGVYAAASRISEIVVFALAATNAIVAPMIARLYAREDRVALEKLIRTVAWLILLVTVPVALLVLLFGEKFLSFFGPGFGAGYTILIILVGGQLINSLCGPVGYLLGMTGHQRTAMRIVAGSAVLNVALNALLIPVFGAIGAAVATAASLATWNLLMLRAVRLKLGPRPSILSPRYRLT